MRAQTYLVMAFIGCGGTVLTVPDGGDAGTDGSVDGTPNSDGGWTTCTSPTGQRVCDGPNQCSHDDCVCPFAGGDSPDAVHACTDSVGFDSAGLCAYVADGLLCVAPEDKYPDGFLGAEYDMGVLFANNGAPDRVRYADYGLWSGATIPEPANCPTLATAVICGGNCGGCGVNTVCHGRSPLHPWGFCLQTNIADTCDMALGTPCASTVNGCFAFKVEDAAQAVANHNSVCLPLDLCNDLAANLPGGGICQ